MTHMTRLKSFTMIELVVSLIIGSIVTGILYNAWFIFSRQFDSYRDTTAWMNEYLLLEKGMQQDIKRADAIRDSTTKVLLLDSETNGRTVSYEFTDSSVIRRNENSEQVFFLKAELSAIRWLSDSARLVNIITLNCERGKSKIDLTFQKQYSAQQILQFQQKYEQAD